MLPNDGVDGDEPLRAVFIRAPWLEDAGADVEVLAEVDGHPVLAREGRLLVAAFHPELTDDTRVHERFLNIVREETARVGLTERAKRAKVPALPAPGVGNVRA
jgi:glutamine amidotransferase PdxT